MANPLGGPPPAFKSPAIFKKRIIEYLEYCKEVDEIPFIVGFAVYTKIPLKTIEGYKHYEGFQDYYEWIKDASHNTVLQGGMNKKYSDKITGLVLKNHHKYDAVDIADVKTAQSHIVEIVVAQPPPEIDE